MSSSSTTSSSSAATDSAGPTSTVWQEALGQVCTDANLPSPIFEYASDRRGGRTAWSSTVTVKNVAFQARFWYSGSHLNNAREDAAEVACSWLSSKPGE